MRQSKASDDHNQYPVILPAYIFTLSEIKNFEIIHCSCLHVVYFKMIVVVKKRDTL